MGTEDCNRQSHRICKPQRLSDYERFKGRLAKFWLNDGRVIIGRIKEVHEKSLTLESNGNDICFQADQVKKSRLEVEF